MAMTAFPQIPSGAPAQAADNIRRVMAYSHDEQRFTVVDGAVQECTGRDAVQQWIALMLRQTPGKTPVYGMDGAALGVDRAALGQRLPEGFVRAEIERQIRATLAHCPAIRAADNFTFQTERRRLTVTFTVYLQTGEQLEVIEHVDGE